jgi:hypothetical protein
MQGKTRLLSIHHADRNNRGRSRVATALVWVLLRSGFLGLNTLLELFQDSRILKR